MIRIGQGYDVHQLVSGRPLILGGIPIPYEKGLAGHSDADALLHAIIDALIGAAGLGDIGQHFPDTDPHYKNANSRQLLQSTHTLITQSGWKIINIDSTIIAQQPKLMPYLPLMRQQIAEDLSLSVKSINIKAKTNESLGYLGRGEAIEAQVSCLIMALNQ